MDELREKIARILAQFGIGNIFEQDAIDQIIALINEAGYVKLADKQEIDIPDMVFFSAEAKACGFTKRSFLEANWRKVEL